MFSVFFCCKTIAEFDKKTIEKQLYEKNATFTDSGRSQDFFNFEHTRDIIQFIFNCTESLR